MRRVLILCLTIGCSGSQSGAQLDGSSPRDAAIASGDAATSSGDGAISDDAAVAAGDMAITCTRMPQPADRARKVVVSHPFSESGDKATAFEVLDLSATGTLTRGGPTFMMGTALDRPIRFTPDGAVGYVAQDDGSVGIFRLDPSGNPTVVAAKFQMGFYAQDVAVSPDGHGLFVLDFDTENNGGGLYPFTIACDGSLSAAGARIPGDNAAASAFLDDGSSRAVVAVKHLLGATSGDTELLDLSGSPSLVASGSVFSDGMGIASSVEVTPDGKFALVTDNGLSVGNRVGVLALPAMTPLQVLSAPNPAQVIASPFGNAALLLDSDGMDAIRVLSYDAGNATMPFAITGEITYVNGKPQLPSTAAMITRGQLEGRVLVGENAAVRQVQFGMSGGATDVSLLAFGGGLSDIVGVVGVQP